MSAPPPEISLERFEQLVYSRQHEEAARCLVSLLSYMRRGHEPLPPYQDDAEAEKCYARLVSAVTALMTDPNFHVSQEGFLRFASEHRSLEAVFQASVFDNSDHLVRQFARPDPADPARVSFDRATVAKALLCYSLDSGIDLDFDEALATAPSIGPAWILALLAHISVMSEQAYQRRERMLQLGAALAGADINERMVTNLQDAYMHCSYAASPTKHAIKRDLNACLRRFVEARVQLPTLPPRSARKQRPTIVVPLERFDSLHAMYRCYGPSIAALRARFHLVAAGPAWALDATARDLFDEAIDIGTGTPVDQAVRLISDAAPDMIYYPSVGMTTWCVALASIRLAPIQMLTLGHPATTGSPEMDYVLVSDLTPGSPANFSEVVVLLQGFASMLPAAGARFPVREVRASPEVLRIAVPSMAAKLSAPFLRTCRAIAFAAARPVEFHFFPGVAGVHWHQARRMIQRWLPGARVHRPLPYNDYMLRLKECDVHLSSFPFGGTNSNFDSMKLGIPMVTLEGDEVHSQTDAAMMRLVGLPEWLISRDIRAYEAAALRLISDDALRCGLSRQLLQTDLDVAFLDRPGHAYSGDFRDAVAWIYEAHERIQSSGRRYWTVAEREAFVATTATSRAR